MQVDSFGIEFPSARRGYVQLALRTLVLDQLIALPVALVMTSAGVPFLSSYLIASVYSQSIGLLCAATSVSVLPRLDRLPPARSLAGVVALYFVCGVAGAEVARRLTSVLLVPASEQGPAYLSWAIGATVALFVGLVLTTVRALRRRVLSTELEALQARINPHFLFNTLNSIAALIRDDPARAEAMTLQLSALFRYTVTAPRQGLVTLDEELAIVEGYLGIEQERLGSRLTYAIEVEQTLRELKVPALTLQPLVENAIKHGVAASVEGGSVRVRAWREGARVHLAVINTGGGAPDDSGTGEGLENVRRRLRATFGSATSVTLTADGLTTEARLTLPVAQAGA